MSTRAIGTFLVTIFIASRVSAAPPPDSEAAKLLIGSWGVPVEQYNGMVKAGGDTFLRDGTFTSFTIVPRPGQDLRIDTEGKWSIQGGILIEQVTKSSQPAIDYCRLQQRSAASEQNKERSATSYAQPLVLCPKRRCQARKLSILRLLKVPCICSSMTMLRPKRFSLIFHIPRSRTGTIRTRVALLTSAYIASR